MQLVSSSNANLMNRMWSSFEKCIPYTVMKLWCRHRDWSSAAIHIASIFVLHGKHKTAKNVFATCGQCHRGVSYKTLAREALIKKHT